MKLTSLTLSNIKGFSALRKATFSNSLNVFVGPNNSGKSTILKAFNLLQNAGSLSHKDIKIGASDGYIDITTYDTDSSVIRFTLQKNTSIVAQKLINNGAQSYNIFTSQEPNNIIYPFFSKRKVTSFQEVVNIGHTVSVPENLAYLYSKIDRISNIEFPSNKEYQKHCLDILGFHVTAFASQNGKQAGIVVTNFENISLESMGEGITNLLGLIVDLCIAQGKIFLIEEPENDIHPKALKALLELIIKKSETNQFFISTHSNIVVKYLGSIIDTKIFKINMTIENRVPNSIMEEVPNTSIERIKVLEELGYDLFDFDLYKAYLILEESSAEQIIRDFLLPNFFPGLKNKIKTIAASGVSDLGPRFNDLLRLFVFINNTETYKDKAWIIADGDESGMRAIKDLQGKFGKWNKKHFLNLSKKNFEEYYPERFQEKAKKALDTIDRKERFIAKFELTKEVIKWIEEDNKIAIREFKESAKEVITILSIIEKQIFS